MLGDHSLMHSKKAISLQEFSSPARLISDSLEVTKQRKNETKKGSHARFELGTSKSLQKLSFPPDFTPRVRREWKQKKISRRCALPPHYAVKFVLRGLIANSGDFRATRATAA